MLTDKNNAVIQIGDIVRIENSPIKSDNATYVVAQDGTSKNYTGKDLTLYKVAKHKGGYSLSRSAYNICFYPLHSFSNKYKYTREELNAATIEILMKCNEEAFEIIKIDNQYENEETEQTYFRAEIKCNDKQIEDVSYSCNQSEKLVAFFSNITLKDGETIQLTKQDNTWGYYYKSVSYELRDNRPEETKEDTKQQEPAEEEQQEINIIEEAKQEEGEVMKNESIKQLEPETKTEKNIKRKYFPINEQLAKTSQTLWSFYDYKEGSATESYKADIENAYKIVDRIANEKPERLQNALTIVERYSKAYADWKNKGFAIEMMCPSVMICGAGNFPVKKKERQNQARDKHMEDFGYIKGYLKKLEDILYSNEVIRSGDIDAIEKLTDKLKQLEDHQELMKGVNAFYRKHKTLEGCELIDQKTINTINDLMARISYHTQPFASYELTNNNANIKNTKQRLEQLQKAKSTPTQATIKTDICQVVENTEIMRIQLIFEGKPDEETRNILKSNGFKWAPSQGAWQRQLTDNARYSTKKAIKQLEELQIA